MFDNLFKEFEEVDELFSKISTTKVAEGIKRVREKKLEIIPGYDGEYGIIKIFGGQDEKTQDQQMTLF